MNEARRDDRETWMEEVLERVFAGERFLGLTLNAVRDTPETLRLRRVALRGEEAYAFEICAGDNCTIKNHDAKSARNRLERRLREPFRNLHLRDAAGDLHVRITKRGRALVARSRPLEREVDAAPAHDRVKATPLTAFDSTPLLAVLGLAREDGAIRPSMQGKTRQVNAFLDIIRTVIPNAPSTTLHVLDCGCGKAYLTFAAVVYLSEALGRDVRATGIDRDARRIRYCQQLAERLALSNRLRFECSDVHEFTPATVPDLVLSLHACDTATDGALAGGVRWGARALLAAPCCQHDVNAVLRGGGPMRGMLRHGILRQRLGDLLTDTLRAQLLRIAGYRSSVQEFVSPDATARNLLIRAERGVRPGAPEAVAEYRDLRDHWGLRPALETALEPEIGHFLA